MLLKNKLVQLGIALGLGMGLLLSLTRRNPYLSRSTLNDDWKQP